MEKVNNQKFNFFDEQEFQILCLASILAKEELPLETFCRIVNQSDTDSVRQVLNKICLENWVIYRYGNIVYKNIDDDDMENCSIEEEIFLPNAKNIVTVLTNLHELLVSEPQTFCTPARLFLTYIMDHSEKVFPEHLELISLFSQVVTNFVPLIEMSLNHNARKAVNNVEDRLDSRLLFLVQQLHAANEDHYRLLGGIYAESFQYDKATEYFDKAEELMFLESDLLLAKAHMYENMGNLGKAVQLAYQAYEQWEYDRCRDVDKDICLYLAYLCAVSGDTESSKTWLSRLNGKKLNILQSIRMKEVKALLCKELISLAVNTLKRAELSVLKYYGSDAPELAHIAYIRCLLKIEDGKLHAANKEYRIYIENYCYNYGYSVGAEVALLTSLLNECICQGNDKSRMSQLSHRLADLNPTNPDIAPGVRLAYALASYMFFCNIDQMLCAYNCRKMALHLCYDLIPQEDTLKVLHKVFNEGKIPKSIMLCDEIDLLR